MKSPDIENGYAIIRAGRSTAVGWRTEISAVLENKTRGGRAYLTSRCLAERISGSKIFPAYTYEFCVVKTWRGNFALRAGPYLYGLNGACGNAAHEPYKGSINAFCPSAECIEHSADSLAARFQEEKEEFSGKFFMKIFYEFSGENYEITAPAKYINFSFPTQGSDFYLQPITDYVLFFNGENFSVSCIAAHINKSGVHIEISARKKVPFMTLKPHTGRLYKALRIFRPALDRLFVTDDFCDIHVVPGGVRFFTYQRNAESETGHTSPTL